MTIYQLTYHSKYILKIESPWENILLLCQEKSAVTAAAKIWIEFNMNWNFSPLWLLVLKFYVPPFSTNPLP